MDADKTVTATFAQDQYTLTVNIVGQGNVTRVPNQPTYTYGTSVQLTAVPQGGWSFSLWGGGLSGSTNPNTIIMNGNRTVTATFTQIMHTLTIAVSGSGNTTPAAGSYSYAEGTVVTISATASTGWHFSTWSANVANPSLPSTTVTMDADKTVTATFVQDQYTLTVNIVGQGNVTRVPNQATYTYDTSVQLTAVPQGGWSFSSWSGDLLGSTNPDTIIMNGNRTVTATFTNSPAVATDSAQNVTSGSATLRGVLNNKGTATTVFVSFEWATDDYYTNNVSSYNNETTPPWPMVSTDVFSSALGGLSPETTYHFRARAVGNGTAYGDDMTFTTGGEPGVGGGGGCFIATAAYGSSLDNHVDTLRSFRDQYLETNPIGSAFVSLYYKVSPPMAEFINEYPALKPIVRVGLLPAVVMSTVAVNTTMAEKLAILASLALVCIALAIWVRERARRLGRGR
jgi:hypothetical protein